jgi:hypothetical protein
MEVLNVSLVYLFVRDLIELEPAETMTDVNLFWFGGPSIEKVLPVLKKWRHLNRLILGLFDSKISVPPLEVLSDFIMEMKQLSYLHIVPKHDRSNDGQLKILRDKVNELILPRRPNFKFDISRSDD